MNECSLLLKTAHLLWAMSLEVQAELHQNDLFFLVVPVVCRSSQISDQICATVVTQATAVIMLDLRLPGTSRMILRGSECLRLFSSQSHHQTQSGLNTWYKS